MKFSTTTLLLVSAALVSAAPTPSDVAPVSVAMGKRDFEYVARDVLPRTAKRSVNVGPTKRDLRRTAKRAVDAALIPQFGIASGVNPTGTGDCDGVNGIKIPCSCPPTRQSFVDSLNKNVDAGQVINNPSVKVSFPTDSSKNSQLARMQTALVTLQNLFGPGKGCPAAATTFLAQQKAIQDFQGPAGAAPPPPPPAAAPVAAIAVPAAGGSQVAALAPSLGRAAGINPTGTGDCDGVNGPNGQAIKVPCSCPPAQAVYIAQLEANVAAGQAVNNPSVKISFPTGNSKEDKSARITAALITLQNLNGPGKGCPASSTTLVAQQKAL